MISHSCYIFHPYVPTDWHSHTRAHGQGSGIIKLSGLHKLTPPHLGSVISGDLHQSLTQSIRGEKKKASCITKPNAWGFSDHSESRWYIHGLNNSQHKLHGAVWTLNPFCCHTYGIGKDLIQSGF